MDWASKNLSSYFTSSNFTSLHLLGREEMKPRTHIVALQVEARKVDRDSVLLWSDYLPHTVLVGRIEIWKGRTVDRAICCVQIPSARV